eukprot:5874079-Amphidinium_carterae.1
MKFHKLVSCKQGVLLWEESTAMWRGQQEDRSDWEGDRFQFCSLLWPPLFHESTSDKCAHSA